MTAASPRPTREQVEAALAHVDAYDPEEVGPEVVLAAEVRALRDELTAVAALPAEWEQEANAPQPLALMGYEIHEMNGEQSTCRAHAAELREALGAAGSPSGPLLAVPDGEDVPARLDAPLGVRAAVAAALARPTAGAS